MYDFGNTQYNFFKELFPIRKEIPNMNENSHTYSLSKIQIELVTNFGAYMGNFKLSIICI